MMKDATAIEALGDSALALWPKLPNDIQRALFEQVVAQRGEQCRHDLATFLHNHHPRTADVMEKHLRQMSEPDSIGG